MSARKRVLYVAHNHPTNRPGGAEAYAYDFFQAMRSSEEFEPLFLAKAGPPMSDESGAHENTPFALVGKEPDEYFVYTRPEEYHPFFGTARDKRLYTEHFRRFLLSYKPDVVHFQHTLFLGYDLIREVRNTLGNVPILYTLHEYLPICHHAGQMVRSEDYEQPYQLCTMASPRRCHECFPKQSLNNFFLREQFIKAHLSLVDMFIAPSHFIGERHASWGIPEDKIRFEDYGRFPVEPIPDPPADRPRNVLGFFGQFTRFKGVDVLLEAMRILTEKGEDVQLRLHGANLEIQKPQFRKKIEDLLAETEETTMFLGRYEHEQLPNLLSGIDWVIVPSIWWENSPLVIQEAFLYGRPVICSNIGGMAEKVTEGVDGLHFAVRDPQSLADTIQTAISTPGLWETLRGQIRGAHPMDQHVETMSSIYRDLLERSAAPEEAIA